MTEIDDPGMLRGFAPIRGEHDHTLILGSMPSVRSLAQNQYYGHPQNRFWPLMAALTGFEPDLPYDERCARLSARGIAVWDVLAQCRRPGSLDSAIETGSMVINPIAAWVNATPAIERVLLNGGMAARLFDRHVAPDLTRRIEVWRLPSTSPANARWSLADLRRRWGQALPPAPVRGAAAC